MKLSVSSWSLRQEIPHIQGKYGPYRIKLTDFVRVCVEEFGVDAVELCYQHFPSMEWDYLHEVKESLEKCGARLVNIPLDLGSAAEPDLEKRKHDFEMIRRWFFVARYLGAPSVRVNAGRGVDEVSLRRAIEGYKDLARTAKETGVKLLIENHGGISENPDNVITIIKEARSEYLGTCPDFGNFPEPIRYEGLEKMSKYAAIVHAKAYDFDEQGEETTINFGRCIGILKRQGFDGYYSVEYEGRGDQREGVRKSLALLRKYL